MQIKKICVNGRDNVVKLAALIGLGVFVAKMLKMDTVVSALFACSFVCVAANYLAFISARKRLRLDDIAIFLLTFLSLVLSDWQLSFDYYKPAIIVVCCILCIDQSIEVTVSEKTCEFIHLLLMLVCVTTNGLYYFAGLRYAYYGSTHLTNLNLGNPNETAMWLTFLIVLLYDSVSIQRKKGMKLLTFLGAVSLIVILLGTGARNCIFAISFYLACKLFIWSFKIKKLPKWFTFVIMMTPVLVYVGYMYVFIPNYDHFSKLLLFLQTEGKPLDGRTEIWSDLEMSQIKFVLFGNYTVYHTEQLHNSILTLWCRFGVFYVLVVCNKFFKVLKKTPTAGMQIALSTVWLTGCFETSIFVGIAGMYMLVLLLPIFHQSAMNEKR